MGNISRALKVYSPSEPSSRICFGDYDRQLVLAAENALGELAFHLKYVREEAAS